MNIVDKSQILGSGFQSSQAIIEEMLCRFSFSWWRYLVGWMVPRSTPRADEVCDGGTSRRAKNSEARPAAMVRTKRPPP